MTAQYFGEPSQLRMIRNCLIDFDNSTNTAPALRITICGRETYDISFSLVFQGQIWKICDCSRHHPNTHHGNVLGRPFDERAQLIAAIDRIGSPLALARYTFAAQFWCAFTDFTTVVRMLWLFGFASHMLSVGFCCVSIADQVAEMSSPSRYFCGIWIGRFSSCVLVRFNQEMCLYYTDPCKILKPHEQ